MSRRLINPLTQPTSGANLRKLRVDAGITLEDFARIYAGGKRVEYVAAIESASWVRWNTAQAYRLAVIAITMVRSYKSENRHNELVADGR
jgi:hypothetical protein